MTTMSALAMDAALLGALPGAGTVHSVFRSVINVATPGEQLWSLAARTVPAAPRTVRLPLDELTGLDLQVGAQVTVRGPVILAGAADVDLSAAALWSPSGPAGRVVPERLAELLTELDRLGEPGGARAGNDPFSAAVAGRIAAGLDRIAAAVTAGDTASLRAAAAGLIGLGTGLTPAGDDVLTGLAFASARLGGPLAIVPDAVREAASAGSTHEVSLTALRQACAGRAVQPLADLLAALCEPRGSEGSPTRDRLAALLAIGHTSGTDLAHGLAAAVQLHQTLESTTK